MSKKYLIIGGSAAGPKVASKIRRLDQEADITIIQKGKYLSMASCGYPYFVGGVFDNPNQLIATPTGVPRDPNFFAKVKNIKALIQTEALSIDRENKTVLIKDLPSGKETSLSYDKLVLSTGATPVKPPIEGIDLENIDTLQSMEDAMALKDVAKEKKIKKAVVVGGGLIGIETCEAFQLAGIEVTVVEMQDQILPFLDWEMAKLVQNHMTAKGVKVITGKGVTKFLGDGGKVTGVEITGGEVIPCEHAVFSIGVRPNIKLAQDAGLEIGNVKGISVNRFMQTSDENIYAAGDCVEVTNLITHNKQHWPMGDAANLQGRVVAQNAVLGNSEEYEGIVGTGICKVFEYTAGSTGLSEKMARREGYENIVTAIHAAPDKPGFMGAAPVIIKTVADKTTGKFLGMQSVGSGDVSKRVAMSAMALHGQMSVFDMVNLDLPYAPPFSPAIDNLITAIHVMENKLRGYMVGISAVELKEALDSGAKPFILDVRGPDEYEAMRLGIGETLIPLGALRSKADQLPPNESKEIITYCKISLRGYEAARILEGMGYTNVKVLEGGVVSWPFPREK
ncbi:MAG: FAD-dependent oxidoreductase [Spirochaetales bacterium]|nr:FAD-dependent oxidoreductase [Spirochaetales bacterium]